MTEGPTKSAPERIQLAHETLLAAFGPQRWWPGGGPFEVMVGAVLTQNTSWRNVEHALERVRAAGAMDPGAMAGLSIEALEELSRPAGSWRRKARTLSDLAGAAAGSTGGLEGFLSMEASELRARLLSIKGIGPETADAILHYAAGHAVFVVDAYARRYLTRHGIAGPRESYDAVQRLVEQAVGPDGRTLGECHALLVELGKRYCRPTPACDQCPLREDLPAT